VILVNFCALPLLALGIYPTTTALMAGFFLAGVSFGLFGVVWAQSLQTHIPPEKLARVYAYDALGSFVAIPVGEIAAGPLAQHYGSTLSCWPARWRWCWRRWRPALFPPFVCSTTRRRSARTAKAQTGVSLSATHPVVLPASPQHHQPCQHDGDHHNDKERPCGRVVRIIPVNSGFIAAPSQPSAWAEK
jgi:MFS family permease